MLSLGIVGCGRVTSMFHVGAIEEVPGVKIAAISDIDPKRVNIIEKRCSVPNTYETFYKLLEDKTVNAIAVNTPPRFHEEMVLKALDAGKHFLCEKPLSSTVNGCLRIKDKVEETGLVVLPARNYSFTPGLYMMEKLISEGSIGKLTSMRLAFENNLRVYKPVSNFRIRKENGLIEDVLPHVLSVVHPILGYCVSVEDIIWSCRIYDVCDNMSTLLKTSSGVDVQCFMSWTKVLPSFQVEIQGEKGRLSGEFSLKPFTVEIENDEGLKVVNEKGLSWYLDLIRLKHPSFQNQYKHFVDLVNNGGHPRITIQDEINLLETIEALSKYMEI